MNDVEREQTTVLCAKTMITTTKEAAAQTTVCWHESLLGLLAKGRQASISNGNNNKIMRSGEDNESDVNLIVDNAKAHRTLSDSQSTMATSTSTSRSSSLGGGNCLEGEDDYTTFLEGFLQDLHNTEYKKNNDREEEDELTDLLECFGRSFPGANRRSRKGSLHHHHHHHHHHVLDYDNSEDVNFNRWASCSDSEMMMMMNEQHQADVPENLDEMLREGRVSKVQPRKPVRQHSNDAPDFSDDMALFDN